MPLQYIDDVPFPRNDSRKYNYSRTIFSGIVSSVNAISANTLDAIGTSYGYSFAKYNFGQNSLTDSYALANGQSLSDVAVAPLALGALTVGSTVREMSAAYGTFANNGIYREPRLYTKVYNSEGQLILDNTQDTRQIVSEKTVEYMNYCLYNAANSGTGGAAIFPGQTIAGKTGTTSSNRDRWFCGFTGYYTAAVWCGYNQPEQIESDRQLRQPCRPAVENGHAADPRGEARQGPLQRRAVPVRHRLPGLRQAGYGGLRPRCPGQPDSYRQLLS